MRKLVKSLRDQVRELEKLVKLKDKRINELEQRALETPRKDVFIPFTISNSPCEHTYPTPWNGTVPPSCTKCGQTAAASPFWATSTIKTVGFLDQI